MSQFFKGTTGAPAIGNVIGPASSTDNAVVRFDGVTGKIIQNSVVIVDDLGNLDSQGTSVGATKSFLNQNNDNTAGSAAKSSLLVGGTSAGDAYNEWSIGASRAYSFGVDNDDSQTFKLTTDAAANVNPSSGTSLLEITSAGQVSLPAATLTLDGVLVVGASGLLTSTAVGTATHVLTSNGVGFAPTFQAVASSGAVDSFAPNSGTNPVVPDGAGVVTMVGDGSITTVGGVNSLTTQLTGLTQYNVLVGAGTTTIAKVAPGSAGIALVSTGAAAEPAFGTTTIPGGGTGSTSFTAGSVIFSNGTILTQDNSSLFFDDTNNRLGIGITTPLHPLHIVGNMQIDYTATENDDHAFDINANAAGFSDVKALDVIYTTGAIGAGDTEDGILINIDETLAVGGQINAIQVLSTTEGIGAVTAIKMGPEVDAIRQEVGTFGNMDSALNNAANVLAALSSGGAGNISMFVADNDTVTIGDAATFGALEIIIATPA